jgi:hypothetical protein
VDDHVLIEVLETTNNFDAVLLRDYSLTSDTNGGRYIPSMRLTRREGITAIEFGGLQMLVDATPDGESFDSLTLSTALYATTEGTAGDTMRVSVESAWISGDYADPTGDWIVVGFEVANVGDSLNLDCPDPRICAVNDSSYSSPQWEVDATTFEIGSLTIDSSDWRRVWSGCVGNYTPHPSDPLEQSDIGQIPEFMFLYWGKETATRISYTPPNGSGAWPTDVGAFDGAMTPFDAAHQSYTLTFVPRVRSTLLSSTTPGKRKVRLQMWLPVVFNWTAGTDYKFLYIYEGPNQTWINPPTSTFQWGYDPALATQMPGYNSYVHRTTGNDYCVYEDDGAGGYQFRNLTTGVTAAAPAGFDESVASGTYPYYDPVYVIPPLPVELIHEQAVTWEKEVDEWDGEPPTIEFESTDIVSSPGTVAVITSLTVTFDGVSDVTVKGYDTPSVVTWQLATYPFTYNYTHATIDFTNTVVAIKPTTEPMPQPINL